MPSLIGNKPNQVPSNGDLGTLAFQDSNAVNLTGGTAVIDNLTADAINLKVDTDISNIAPSLNLDFANSKTLDPRITFTRASTATFYDGITTAKAEENLFTFSQEFDNASWAKTRVTVTANSTTAPDGTTTAELITATASTGDTKSISVVTASISGQTVSSIFAKAGTHNFIQLAQGGDAQHFANFDLSTGTVGTVGTKTTASITSVGNGWYRCIAITDGTSAVTALTILMAASNTAARLSGFTTVGTETVFLWGAQLEQRSAVSSYTPTTTAPITNYIPVLRTAASGVARFEHNPITGESLGLLIEEARTNIALQSEDFTTTWLSTAYSSAIQANASIAPDGALTADKFYEDTGTTSHLVRQTITTTAVATTFSVYAKAGERSWVVLALSDSGNTVRQCWFNLATGVVGTAQTGLTTSITAVGNGWYRCVATIGTAFAGFNVIRMYTATADNAVSYTGDGYSGLYVWGAQLEAGAFATSYIPTVASQVTRAADAASMTGTNFSSWFNNQEGTLYSDFVGVNNVSGTRRVLDMSTGGLLTDRIAVGYSSLTNTRVLITTSNVTQADITVLTGITAGSNVKISAAYKTNDFQQASNATLGTADTSGVVPPMTQLNIGSDGASTTSTILNGTIKKLQYFPKRLTNAELVEMTS